MAANFDDHMFFDETKRAMVSVEQYIDAANHDYRRAHEQFDLAAMDAMVRRGLGVERLEVSQPDANAEISYRVDPTIISTDIESVEQIGRASCRERVL